jgi:iron(III) transport system permease protein
VVLVLLVLAALLAWPVLTLLGAWWMLDAAGWAQWQHLAQTVLPGYVAQTAWLVLGVGLGTLLVGGGAATLVSLFEFRGRRWLDALLLLPMAMPAYVAAYAYTDALQFAGPLQSGLRQWFGWQGALWGDVRSLPGAVLLFTLCLYPYVYLLVRTALAERAAAMLEAAQMLGAPLHRRVLQVALPMARPALAAGLMLVLMETLADYGVGSYFGLNTLSTGVYKAWLVHDDRWAAAQIASLLLGIALTCLWLERRAQARMRFASGRGGGEGLRQPLNGAAALAAQAACLLPLLAGFVLPVLILARLVWREARYGEFGLPWERFGGWALSSLKLALAAATLAVALALLITALQRLKRQPAWRNAALRGIGTLVAMGYAMPGAAIAVALLLPLQPLAAALAGAGAALHRNGAGADAGLLRAVHRRGLAERGRRLRAPARQPGRKRAPAGAQRLGSVVERAPALADALGLGRRVAGVRRRDEGVARHVAAAPLRQRHPGRGGLPAGAR